MFFFTLVVNTDSVSGCLYFILIILNETLTKRETLDGSWLFFGLITAWCIIWAYPMHSKSLLRKGRIHPLPKKTHSGWHWGQDIGTLNIFIIYLYIFSSVGYFAKSCGHPSLWYIELNNNNNNLTTAIQIIVCIPHS